MLDMNKMKISNIINLIVLMSFFDLIFTLRFIGIDPFLEVNPLMRKLWIINPYLFIIFKLTATLFFYLVARKYKGNRFLAKTIWIPFLLYFIVMGVHLF